VTRPLADLELEAIIQAILACGSVTKAAAALQITRVRIYRTLKREGLKRTNSPLRTTELLAELRRQRLLKF
jgi:hypothetical protein